MARPALKIINIVSWVLVVAAGGLLLANYALEQKAAALRAAGAPAIASTADIGGPFLMTSHKGARVSEKDFSGKPMMLFFGFTHCPAICPGALADMTLWLEKLGADAGKINAVFVSVDPARDDVARMADYLKSFDARITGLTGTPDEVAAMAKAYKIYYKAMPPMADGGYMVDHSASIYLFNAAGKLTSTIDMNEDRAVAFAKIRKLLE